MDPKRGVSQGPEVGVRVTEPCSHLVLLTLLFLMHGEEGRLCPGSPLPGLWFSPQQPRSEAIVSRCEGK